MVVAGFSPVSIGVLTGFSPVKRGRALFWFLTLPMAVFSLLFMGILAAYFLSSYLS